jgi:hypothetical protein
VVADVTLVVPGFDEQPLLVNELGVDGAGRTTWELLTGQVTNTNEDIGFIGTGKSDFIRLNSSCH